MTCHCRDACVVSENTSKGDTFARVRRDRSKQAQDTHVNVLAVWKHEGLVLIQSFRTFLLTANTREVEHSTRLQ